MYQEKLFYLTKEGFERIKKEYSALRDLKSIKFEEIVPQISEGSEYFVFRDDSDFLELKLAKLENILEHTRLIRPPKNNKDVINLGAKVIVEINNKHKNKFEIVGTLESNPSLGRISNESPVGKALLGRKLGDEVIVCCPVKTFYKVKEIKY